MIHEARIALIERAAEQLNEEARGIRLHRSAMTEQDQRDCDDMLLTAHCLTNLANEMRSESEVLGRVAA